MCQASARVKHSGCVCRPDQWLPPPQQQHAQTPAMLGGQAWLDEPAWLPPPTAADGSGTPRHGRQPAPHVKALPPAAPTCDSLLDEPTWLPPAPAAKPRPVTSPQAQPAHADSAARRQQKQQQQHQVAASGGGANLSPPVKAVQGYGPGKGPGGKPKLHLPPPRARTVAGVKKAPLHGGC